MADGSNIGFFTENDRSPTGEYTSIHDFLAGFSLNEQERVLFGSENPLLLLEKSYISYYMRDMSSGPYDISNVAKPVSENRAKVNSIVYNDNLDISFGGIERKTMDNILLLESIYQKFLKGDDMKHVEDCWYDIVEFLQREYTFEIHNNMLKFFSKFKRKKTSGELRNLGLQLIEKLQKNEHLKNS